MKTICVVTATRAEYGLLRNTIKRLTECSEFEVRVAVTGSHLYERFGNTWREIEADGIAIDRKIDIGVDESSAQGISFTMARALEQFGAYFAEKTPDALLVLGDRYEILAVCIAAMNQRIPIFHMCGGETTEGAVDEGIRHAITKLSYLHFAQMEEYRRRIIQLGENPDRVYCVGAPGVENALAIPAMSREELGESIGLKLDKPFGVVTFHPVTLEAQSAQQQVEELIAALQGLSGEMKFIITGANADHGSRAINQAWEAFAKENENVILINSLGQKRYLSALRYCCAVIGNSSSGIIEAPSFHVPTINIGDRQKGRIQAESVINIAPERGVITEAIRNAVIRNAKGEFDSVVNPYANGVTSEKIVAVIREWMSEDKIDLKKKFFDL